MRSCTLSFTAAAGTATGPKRASVDFGETAGAGDDGMVRRSATAADVWKGAQT